MFFSLMTSVQETFGFWVPPYLLLSQMAPFHPGGRCRTWQYGYYQPKSSICNASRCLPAIDPDRRNWAAFHNLGANKG